MKTLKFSEGLPEMILAGEKDVTWRIDDEKNISAGDELSLLRKEDLNEFARAKVLRTKETTFGQLGPEEDDGHEKFSSEEEKYQTYSSYYQTPITPQTAVKVIKFQLIA